MKAKRLLALITTATLIVLPTASAFAGTLTGVTNVDYVDPNGIIVATAPTNASVGFTLDPQGLAGIEGVGDWTPSTGGNILPVAVGVVVNSSSAPIKADISFTLTDSAGKIVLVDSATGIDADTANNMYLTITPADDKVVANYNSIAETTAPTFFKTGDPAADKSFTAADLVTMGLDGTSAKVKANAVSGSALFGDFVCMDDTLDATALDAYDFAADADSITFCQVEVPAHAAIPATTDVTVSQFNNETSGYADATSKVVLGSTGTGLSYKLNKASYYAAKTAANEYELRRFNYNYSTVQSNNYDTAAFVIGGQINKNADWSDYTTGGETLSLGAVYSFDFMTADEYTNAATLGSSYNSIAYTAPSAPSITPLTYDIAAGTVEVVTGSLGFGALKATGLTSVKDGATTLTSPADYSYDSTAKTITFTADYIDSIIGDGSADASKVLTVTFNDTATTAVNITLNYTYVVPSVAPSVSTTTVNFSKAGTGDVVINYSLGSGASAATAVTQVYIDETATGKFNLLDPAYSSFVTVTSSTITIKRDWVGGYASGSTANVYVRYDMTNTEADATSFTTPDTVISVAN